MPEGTEEIAPMRALAIRLRQWAKTFSSFGECAAQIGVAQPKLSLWFSLGHPDKEGSFGPSVPNLMAMARAGLNIHWLLTGQGPMTWNSDTLERFARAAMYAHALNAELTDLFPPSPESAKAEEP